MMHYIMQSTSSTKLIIETTIIKNVVATRRGMQKSVRTLKAELSACLRRVQAGEECLITSHHQIIAKIVPIQSPTEVSPLDRKSFLNELRAELATQSASTPPLSEEVVRHRQEERY
jgi:antitoxin (DNA-binding transcriptional repressor) of toxin-antitoxin stability system